MKASNIFQLLIILALTITSSITAYGENTIFQLRTWKSADEQKTFVGKLIELSNGTVTIEKDGRPIKFAVRALSARDRKLLGQGVSFTTRDGEEYENVTISKLSPNSTSITVDRASGSVLIRMKNLPTEMRQQFGYDPEKAKIMRRQEMQIAALKNKQAAVNAELNKAELRDCYVSRFVENGLIFNSNKITDTKGNRLAIVTAGTGSSFKQILNARIRNTQYHLKGLPSSPIMVNDSIFSAYMIPDGVYTEGGSRILSFKFVKWGGILDLESIKPFSAATVREVTSE